MSKYPQLNIRVDDEFLKRLDDWRRKQPDLPTRTEALRRLADLALAAEHPPAKPRRKP
jgi:hypothetical protein